MIRLLPCLLLTGCLAPNTVRLQAMHQSHFSQHVDGSGGHIGAELIGVTAHWQRQGWFAEATEAYNVSPADQYRCSGGICGNREVFLANVGYEWRIKP